jgi:ribosomal protein L14E/L6E/L27E
LISVKHDLTERNDKVLYGRAKIVMAALTQIIDDKHLLPQGVTKVKDLILRAGDAIYVHALEALIAWIQEKSGHEVRKPAEVAVGSIYNYLNEMKKIE